IPRIRPARLLAAAALLVLCRSHPAGAQVSVDQGALDSLGTPAPTARPAPIARPSAPARHPAARPSSRHDTAHAPAKPNAPPAKPPVIPAAPPPRAVLPPVEPTVPTRPAPAPPVPVVADAPDTVSPLPGGLRVVFGAGRSDLNPAAVTALRDLAATLKAEPAATLDVNAWSAGTADDPSTPRRLSLARALAVRAVLISEGIASPRIYVRALGSDNGDPPDRAEVTRTAAAAAPAAPAAPAPAASPPPPARAPAAATPAPAATAARKR
ncbi:MAG: OmpA family protein, partial [Janthinobacterium lividum]